MYESNKVLVDFLKNFINVYIIKGFLMKNSSTGSINNYNQIENSKETVLNLIKCYLLCNDILYRNDYLYIKVPNFENSFLQLDTID